MNISEESRRQLAASGWSHSRSIDTTAFERLCRDEGYPVLAEAVRFVRMFGDLVGEHRAYRVSAMDRFAFDPCKAIRDIPKERVDTYAARFGQLMVPVGEVYNQHLTVMVAMSGSLLGGYDDFLCELGLTIEQGLDAIFEAKERRRVV